MPAVQVLPNGSLHVPAKPETLHFIGELHEDVVQQTPSTQLPVVHSLATEHAAPGPPVDTQVVPLQKYPKAQVPDVHVGLQSVAPHVYGAHVLVVPAAHVPAPLQ